MLYIFREGIIVEQDGKNRYQEYWEELYYRMETLATQSDDCNVRCCAQYTLDQMKSIKKTCLLDIERLEKT